MKNFETISEQHIYSMTRENLPIFVYKIFACEGGAFKL